MAELDEEKAREGLRGTLVLIGCFCVALLACVCGCAQVGPYQFGHFHGKEAPLAEQSVAFEYGTPNRVLDGLGIAILSTSKGVMSDRQAKKEKVGGEVLCTVW